MADTRRDRDAFLNASTGLFKDNVAGDISAQDLRDFVYTVFGAMYLDAITSGDVSDLNPTAGTDFDAVAGSFYWVDVPSCNTVDTTDGNVVCNLPASPAAGDRVGVGVSTAATATGIFAQAPGFCVELNPGSDKINGESYTEFNSGGGDRWSLWVSGENLIVEYVNATVGWAVVHDGRYPHAANIRPSADVTTSTSGVVYDLDCDTLEGQDVAKLHNSTDGHLECKRTGEYVCSAHARSKNSLTDGHFFGVSYGDTTATISRQRLHRACSGTNRFNVIVQGLETMQGGSDLFANFRNETTNGGAEDHPNQTGLFMTELI